MADTPYPLTEKYLVTRGPSGRGVTIVTFPPCMPHGLLTTFYLRDLPRATGRVMREGNKGNSESRKKVKFS